MKKFDRIKTIQLLLLIAITAASLVVILRNSELYALIASNMAAKTISVLLWLTLGLSFLFLLYDFSSYADMRRENSELDNAVYSDALTGIANRYSVDAYIGQFLGKPLPEDMGVVTLEMTNLSEINKAHGHSGGDMAIQAFASILQTAAGRACFIGRNGGNKFVALFRDCTETRLERFLDSVESLTDERNTSYEDAPIKYSAGTAFNEGEDVKTVTELVALSDKRAWQAGRK
jgi:diguanylate cyclase (GGDEF)-like protein